MMHHSTDPLTCILLHSLTALPGAPQPNHVPSPTLPDAPTIPGRYLRWAHVTGGGGGSYGHSLGAFLLRARAAVGGRLGMRAGGGGAEGLPLSLLLSLPDAAAIVGAPTAGYPAAASAASDVGAAAAASAPVSPSCRLRVCQASTSSLLVAWSLDLAPGDDAAAAAAAAAAGAGAGAGVDVVGGEGAGPSSPALSAASFALTLLPLCGEGEGTVVLVGPRGVFRFDGLGCDAAYRVALSSLAKPPLQGVAAAAAAAAATATATADAAGDGAGVACGGADIFIGVDASIVPASAPAAAPKSAATAATTLQTIVACTAAPHAYTFSPSSLAPPLLLVGPRTVRNTVSLASLASSSLKCLSALGFRPFLSGWLLLASQGVVVFSWCHWLVLALTIFGSPTDSIPTLSLPLLPPQVNKKWSTARTAAAIRGGAHSWDVLIDRCGHVV